jgi:rubrerythrin
MWQTWRRAFELRKDRPIPAVDDGSDLPAAWVPVLAESLAVFQAGETGEGRVVAQARQAQWACIDDDYRAALTLFVAEEGRHARILGAQRRALGAEAAIAPWTESLFRWGRGCAGLRTKLLVLWSAEVAAIVGYEALADRLPPGALRSALREIIEDEREHLRFHTAFFRAAAPPGPARLAAAAGLAAGTAAATAVLWGDHRTLWRTVGVSESRLVRRSAAQVAEVWAALHAAGDPLAVRPQAA